MKKLMVSMLVVCGFIFYDNLDAALYNPTYRGAQEGRLIRAALDDLQKLSDDSNFQDAYNKLNDCRSVLSIEDVLKYFPEKPERSKINKQDIKQMVDAMNKFYDENHKTAHMRDIAK